MTPFYGCRAVKNSASGTRLYFYDIEGRPVAESGPSQGGWLSGHAYFQNRHAFENTGSQLLWRHPDHLGTAVVRTNSIGEKICDSRFYPYGEEFTPPCAGDPYKFTGKERDGETGLDYFGARHYGSYLGRFISPDEPFADQYEEDPQSWNLYGYVRNNPLNSIDPTGRKCVRLDDGSIGDDGEGESCQEVEDADGKDGENVPPSVTVVEWLPEPLNPFATAVLGRVEYLAGPTVRGLAVPTLGFVAVTSGAGVVGLFRTPSLASLGIAAAPVTAHPRFHILIGQGLTRVRPMSGRLAGYFRGNTTSSGGEQAARQVFQQVTGRPPSGAYDRVVRGSEEIVFRATGGSGHPKIDYINHTHRTYEHITFK